MNPTFGLILGGLLIYLAATGKAVTVWLALTGQRRK